MKPHALHIGFLAALLLATPLLGDGPTLTEADRLALETGRAILAVDKALQYALPDAPSPEQVAESEKLTKEMVRVGQITSLYSWVSARVVWEIGIAEHLLRDTRPDEARAKQLTKRIKYLQRAKLLIDAPL